MPYDECIYFEVAVDAARSQNLFDISEKCGGEISINTVRCVSAAFPRKLSRGNFQVSPFRDFVDFSNISFCRSMAENTSCSLLFFAFITGPGI